MFHMYSEQVSCDLLLGLCATCMTLQWCRPIHAFSDTHCQTRLQELAKEKSEIKHTLQQAESAFRGSHEKREAANKAHLSQMKRCADENLVQSMPEEAQGEGAAIVHSAAETAARETQLKELIAALPFPQQKVRSLDVPLHQPLPPLKRQLLQYARVELLALVWHGLQSLRSPT